MACGLLDRQSRVYGRDEDTGHRFDVHYVCTVGTVDWTHTVCLVLAAVSYQIEN